MCVCVCVCVCTYVCRCVHMCVCVFNAILNVPILMAVYRVLSNTKLTDGFYCVDVCN